MSHTPKLILWLTILMLAFGTSACAREGFPPAPEFPEGLTWHNVERPLKLADLRGKVVILDFWTYGCINCIHVMEELRSLRERFGNKLAVIAVHSPKFENEEQPEALERFLARSGRDEPVVNDPLYRLMRIYGARAWPTMAVIDPAGGYVGKVSGEGVEERLGRAIEVLLEVYSDQIDDRPIALTTARNKRSQWFSAPEKIAVSDNRIAVSDAVLNRVLVTDRDGRLLHIIGGEEAGRRDGTLEQARFRGPRGLAFDGDQVLYLADTGNHQLRRIDLAAGRVETIAGSGKRGLADPGRGKPRELDLRSPWDLALDGERLYVAMAGEHQIWVMDLAANRLEVFAGSGREGIRDGALELAAFSQPSGLSLADGKLYVADAEASAIRVIDLQSARVETLIGEGLFEFGDSEGPLEGALLQHAQGVAALPDGDLLIADTYNHRLKRIDLGQRQIRSLYGVGQPGVSLGAQGRLDEPGGVAVAGRVALVADTNNARVLELDLDGGGARAWVPRQAAD